MDKERQISEGIKTLKVTLGSLSQRGRRYHRSAAEDDLQRLRALEGLCGHCERVMVKVVKVDRRMRTAIDCQAGYSPLDLYYNTPMVEEADCPGFTPRE